MRAAEIDRELIDREACRRWLLPYVERYHPGYHAGWFHRKVCTELQAFIKATEREESPRLILCAPPRSGKSQIVSRALPTWTLGQHPDWEAIIASYAQDLADGLGRHSRNIVSDPSWANIFPRATVRHDGRAVDRIDLAKGGGARFVGVGGGLTGFGGRVLIGDDLVRGREDADSKRMRESTWDWYTSVFRTRAAPGAGILIMGTRWHEDDIIGRLIEGSRNGTGELFRVISFPAIAEEDEQYRRRGQALHPERYPLKDLEALRKSLPSRDWLSLYQQRPAAPDGTFFSVGLVNVLPGASMPEFTHTYQAWDTALTASGGDWSVGVCVGLDTLGRYWLIDAIRGQWSSDKLVEQMMKFHQKHGSQHVWIENGPIYSALMPFLRRAMRDSAQWMPVSPVSHRGKAKDVRATTLRAVVNGGALHVVSGLRLWPTIREEMTSFPAGKHDDCVDALAHIMMQIGAMRQDKALVIPTRTPTVQEVRSREARESFDKASLKARKRLRLIED